VSVSAVESKQSLILVELGLVVDVHTLAEVLPKLNGLVDACVGQLTSELKDEERFGDAVLLDSRCLASDLFDCKWLDLNLAR
jgi:hypothetical protein